MGKCSDIKLTPQTKDILHDAFTEFNYDMMKFLAFPPLGFSPVFPSVSGCILVRFIFVQFFFFFFDDDDDDNEDENGICTLCTVTIMIIEDEHHDESLPIRFNAN